jgi:hypothetical protein
MHLAHGARSSCILYPHQCLELGTVIDRPNEVIRDRSHTTDAIAVCISIVMMSVNKHLFHPSAFDHSNTGNNNDLGQIWGSKSQICSDSTSWRAVGSTTP